MQNGYNLTKDQLKLAWRIISAAVAVGLVVLFFMLKALAGGEVSPDSAAWESIMSARLVLFRLAVAIPVAVAIVWIAACLFRSLDKSPLGARLFHWSHLDDARVKAEKTANAGLALAAILLGLFLVLAGVLR